MSRRNMIIKSLSELIHRFNAVFRKMILTAAALAVLFTSFIIPVTAEEEGTEIIHSSFYVLTTQRNRTMEVAFNRDWFRQDARNYSHDLAKLSLGLATSAFRPSAAERSNVQADRNLSSFLTEAHFTDLRSDDYDKNPDMYTISTVMGHQKIGSFELIAVGVCGQGYMDEWESNFSIGRGEVHDGFSRSAQLVFDRICGYIAENHLEGPYRLWISGFSRAAAVSNVTAAMCSDSSMFSDADVFAYTFATPRTTRSEDCHKYANIFNIVGKADPVPCVPFADWGFDRYGQTFYTPALETDSDFSAKRIKANRIYKDLTGIEYWTNADANAMLRTILTYALTICPSAEIYYNSLQPELIRLWEDRSPLNILSRLLEIAKNPVLINEETREEANSLLNYVSMLIYDYSSYKSVFSRWNNSASTVANLMQSHTPELYISWVFSADSGKELYSESLDYTMLYSDGMSKVSLIHNGNVIETIDPVFTIENGEQKELIPEQERTSPEGNVYLNYSDDQISILIPRDDTYTVVLTPGCDIPCSTLFEVNYTVGRQTPENAVSTNFDLQEGTDLSITYQTDSEPVYSADQASSEIIRYKEQLDVTNSKLINNIRTRMNKSSWREAVIAIIGMLTIAAAICVFTLAYIIGWFRFKLKVRKGWLPASTKFRAYPFICVLHILFLFVVMEFTRALIPDSAESITRFKMWIALLTCFLAFAGMVTRKTHLTLFIFVGTCSLCAADLVTSRSLAAGGALHTAANVLLAYAFIKNEKPERAQIIIWFIAMAVAIVTMLSVEGNYGMMRLLAVAYVAAAVTMVISSFLMPKRTFSGALILFISGLLLMRNEISGVTFTRHLLSLGTFYTGLSLLASTGTQTALPRLVPDTASEKKEIAPFHLPFKFKKK